MSSATRYLLDANVLIALAWPHHVHHRRAREWFATVTAWATTPVTESALIRLSMTPAIAGRAVTMAEAVAVLTAVRAAPGHSFVEDRTSLSEPAIDLSLVATGRQVTDVHLVNIAASSGCVLATLDRGIPAMLSSKDRGHVLVVPFRATSRPSSPQP
jgi:uncharacterized protein